MGTPLSLTLAGRISELTRLTEETARFCRENSLGEEVEFDLTLVLEELFTNVVRHGGCEGMPDAALIRMQMEPAGVALEFEDRGAAFDPLGAPPPNLNATLAERQPGGLGIHLVRQIMRDLRYDRADGWNRITMLRAIERATGVKLDIADFQILRSAQPADDNGFHAQESSRDRVISCHHTHL